MSSLPAVITEINRNLEERKLIGRVRRAARRHNLRLVKSRNWMDPGYKLQSATIIGTALSLEEALAICQKLEGV